MKESLGKVSLFPSSASDCIYRIVHDGENWYLFTMTLCCFTVNPLKYHTAWPKKSYKKHLTLALFIVTIYLYRNTTQKLLLKFESCRKTLFLAHITWCTLLKALRCFNDNLTYKYVYNASHMAGGLEEEFRSSGIWVREREDTNSEIYLTDFWVILSYCYLLFFHFFLLLFFILKK